MSSVEEVCDDIALINHSQVVLSGHVQDVKEQFRTGMYEATTINSELTSTEGLFEVTQHSVQGHLHTYMLQKAEQLSNSELIRAVAERAELRAISEKCLRCRKFSCVWWAVLLHSILNPKSPLPCQKLY